MPNPDFHKNSPRSSARGHTIVPFPKLVRASDIQVKKKAIWIQDQASKLDVRVGDWDSFQKKYSLNPLNTKVQHIRLNKQVTTALNTPGKRLKAAQLAAEHEIDKLFIFLGEDGDDPKYDLKLALKHKVDRGEIATLPQLEQFLKKARELASCLKIFLAKNAFNCDFMQEVSYDIFMNGFEPESQEVIAKKYPNYFS